MYAQTAYNYGEIIVRVLGDADDEVLASFILQGDTLHSLSPREPRAEHVRMAEAHVAHNTRTD